jgi:hypothetical protein
VLPHASTTFAGGDITIVRPPAAAPTRRPEQVEMRRAGIAATTRLMFYECAPRIPASVLYRNGYSE